MLAVPNAHEAQTLVSLHRVVSVEASGPGIQLAPHAWEPAE